MIHITTFDSERHYYYIQNLHYIHYYYNELTEQMSIFSIKRTNKTANIKSLVIYKIIYKSL